MRAELSQRSQRTAQCAIAHSALRVILVSSILSQITFDFSHTNGVICVLQILLEERRESSDIRRNWHLRIRPKEGDHSGQQLGQGERL
jgi:hypothetical protein